MVVSFMPLPQSRPSYTSTQTSSDGIPQFSIGNGFSGITAVTNRKFFLKSNLNLPCCNLNLFFSAYFQQKQRTVYLPHATVFNMSEDCCHVSPQTVPLQSKQTQFFWSFLIHHIFWTFDHSCCSHLDSLQLVHIFLKVQCPKL